MKIKGSLSKLLFILLSSIFVFGMIFTGCFKSSAAGEEAVMEEAEVSREPDMAMAKEAQEEMTSEEGFAEEENIAGDTGSKYGEVPVAGGRKVIKTAYIELEVEAGKFEGTLFELISLAEQNGGFVSNSQSYSDSEGNLTSGSVTIRIPSNKYNSALNRVKEMGTVKSTSSTGQDVTQEYTDLESRLRNYEVQREALRDLMEKSNKVSDSLEVQRELSNVQEQIEVIKGRMDYLDDLVSFSTIEVYFHEPEPIKTASDWGFVKALKRGLRGAVSMFNGIAMVLIATIPVWILAGIIIVIVWQSIRARKRRRARKEQK